MARMSATARSVQAIRLPIPRFGFSPHLLPVSLCQSEFRQNFLVWNGLVVLEPLVGLANGPALRGTERVAVLFCRDHGLQQMHDSSELARPEALQQFVGVLLVA